MKTPIGEANHDRTFVGTNLDDVLEVVAGDILPGDPGERRRRERLYAFRAMDRLGLLGEGDLVPTLARRPALRWLADEEGARVGILAELGRIRDPQAFEAAVRWVLENRPRTDEARTAIRLLRRSGSVGGR